MMSRGFRSMHSVVSGRALVAAMDTLNYDVSNPYKPADLHHFAH